MNKFKSFLLRLILIGICGYAIYQKLEMVATVSLLLFCLLFFRKTIERLFDICFSMIGSAKMAKYKDIELSLGDKNFDLRSYFVNKPAWIRILALRLQPQHIGLLIEIRRVGNYPLTDAIKDRMRELRDCGFIKHNAQTMKGSSSVCLSDLGKEFTDAITETQTK